MFPALAGVSLKTQHHQGSPLNWILDTARRLQSVFSTTTGMETTWGMLSVQIPRDSELERRTQACEY